MTRLQSVVFAGVAGLAIGLVVLFAVALALAIVVGIRYLWDLR